MKLSKLLLCILFSMPYGLVQAKWSNWSEWSWLSGDIFWKVQSNKTDDGGCNYRIRFENKGNKTVILSYDIVNGYGSDGVKLKPGKTAGTVSNFTRHACSQGIQLNVTLE